MSPQDKIKWLILILIALIIGSLIYYLALQIFQLPEPRLANFSPKARLVLDYGNGHQRWFEGRVINGMTLFDALTASAAAGNFNFQISPAGQIEAVDNISNSDKKWRCYLNDNQMIEDVKEQEIKRGQEIVCRYE
jgi:hypothetical protein